MKNEVDRLRDMLGELDVWDEPDTNIQPNTIAEPIPAQEFNVYSDSDDDKKILSFHHRMGGRLEQVVGFAGVHESLKLPQYDLQIGQEASDERSFCSVQALTKYPYKYISAASRDPVTSEFSPKGNLYERVWDFFYIYPPSSISRKAILLVPTVQVEQFLVTINNKLKTHLIVPKNDSLSCFQISFPMDGTPRPRYLGQANEREMAENLKQAIPSASYRHKGENYDGPEASKDSMDAFKKKMELLLETEKRKKAAAKQKKKVERFARQQGWNNLIKRVQQYLGIREAQNPQDRMSGVDKDFSEINKPGKPRSSPNGSSRTTTSRVFNVQAPAPFIQEGSVVFICVDVESFERNHALITEIGIATLDTADIVAKAPGAGGIDWMKAIRARHFRIEDYAHLQNRDFVQGCADFFQFGKSEWISIKDAPSEISKCFRPPYSAPTVERTASSATGSIKNAGGDVSLKRNLILVGHDIITDVNYLKQLGYNVHNLSNLQEVIDTTSMYRAFRREPHPRNLGSILADLDIAGWYLHNAGNDAVYTLQAMLGIAVNVMVASQAEVSREQEIEARVAESVKHAVDTALDAQQGWSSDGGDGGEPESLTCTITNGTKHEKGMSGSVL